MIRRACLLVAACSSQVPIPQNLGDGNAVLFYMIAFQREGSEVFETAFFFLARGAGEGGHKIYISKRQRKNLTIARTIF